MKLRRKVLIPIALTGCVVVLLWTALTLWVEMEGPERWTQLGSSEDPLKVLVIYDPDPIYNFDEQICNVIGKGISEHHIEVIVATTRAVRDQQLGDFDAIVMCANTYNWAPDWAITSFVKENPGLEKVPVIAVTIGSGSTSASHHRLNKLLVSRNIDVIDQHEWWLMRPNDESRMKESNVAVALDEAKQFGRRIATNLLSGDK